MGTFVGEEVGRCECGPMQYKRGVAVKTGENYAGYFCRSHTCPPQLTPTKNPGITGEKYIYVDLVGGFYVNRFDAEVLEEDHRLVILNKFSSIVIPMDNILFYEIFS